MLTCTKVFFIGALWSVMILTYFFNKDLIPLIIPITTKIKNNIPKPHLAILVQGQEFSEESS